jgi:hypothetical protein
MACYRIPEDHEDLETECRVLTASPPMGRKTLTTKPGKLRRFKPGITHEDAAKLFELRNSFDQPILESLAGRITHYPMTAKT